MAWIMLICMGDTGARGRGIMYVFPESPMVYGLPEAPWLAVANVATKWLGRVITAGVIAVISFWLFFI